MIFSFSWNYHPGWLRCVQILRGWINSILYWELRINTFVDNHADDTGGRLWINQPSLPPATQSWHRSSPAGHANSHFTCFGIMCYFAFVDFYVRKMAINSHASMPLDVMMLTEMYCLSCDFCLKQGSCCMMHPKINHHVCQKVKLNQVNFICRAPFTNFGL